MRTTTLLLILGATALAGGAEGAADLLRKGKAKEAAAEAGKLAEKNPGNVDAWLVLADALVAQGEFHDAWSNLEKGIDRNPAAPALCVKLADVFLRLAEEAATKEGSDSEVRGFYSDARRWYQKAQELDAKSADAVHGQAVVAYWLGDVPAARKLLGDALALDPKHGKSHLFQAEIFYREKKYPEAEIKFEEALRIDDSDPVMCLHYGHALYAQGKREPAKAAYVRTLTRHPEYEAAVLSGLLYLVNKDYSKAAPILADAAKEAPKSPAVWFYLGYSHFVNKAFADAAGAFRKAHDLKPEDPRPVFYLGFAAEESGDARKALDWYRKALEANPDYEDPAFRIEGLIQRESDFDAKEKLYEELVRLAPGNALIHNNYALQLRDWAEQRGAATAEPSADAKRRIRRSSEIYEIAARLLPEDPQIQSDTGLMFEFYPVNRNDAKAKEYFSASLQLSGYRYRDAFNGLARLCNRTNDWETLARYAEKVIEAIEGGGNAIAPTQDSEPRELPGETPGLRAAAEAALRRAREHLK